METSSSSKTPLYVCDPVPAPRLVSADSRSSPSPAGSPVLSTMFELPPIDEDPRAEPSRIDLTDREEAFSEKDASAPVPPPQPHARKLCVRHQRIADEGTMLKLQRALDALPVEDREAINSVWSIFSSSSHPRRALMLQGLLTMCCFSQLSFLTEELNHLIRIDPFSVFPREVSLKVLGYLDATSLCRAAQVSRSWRCLADDDILWRGICEQHIGQKCHKCGWGLPILEKRRMVRTSSSPSNPSLSSSKRQLAEDADLLQPHPKRQKSLSPAADPRSSSSQPWMSPCRPCTPPLAMPLIPSPALRITRPWKDVYCERLTIERNWRRGRCQVRTLQGHTDGVMCLQFSETFSHPCFPILITGSYDRTARVWNLETGTEMRCLKGHTRAIRALQFDEAKLITASMDHTLKVWNWRTGKCMRTLEGHSDGVVCLNYDDNLLASGSVDSTIKIWNFRNKECFTLRGHKDWVNSVQIWDSAPGLSKGKASSGPSAHSFDAAFSDATCSTTESTPCIDPGKMLFSASDDGTIRLWDLTLRTCVRQFTGHVGQVQSMKFLVVDECDEDAEPSSEQTAPVALSVPLYEQAMASMAVSSPLAVDHAGALSSSRTCDILPSASLASSSAPSSSSSMAEMSTLPMPKRSKPLLVSGSLDNTIKLWDIETGKVIRTLFGHVEGVWAVASDKLRLVSGSHDRTIKIWMRDEGKCTATLFGHRGAVTCLALGEDKIVSGSDDGDIRIWSFSG
ncbi:WD40 repeat-like protein [Heliocybe sulcata]|uniref:WD40 repeat-like protein n=1 Tax=Heliocybe sulcata TaxID=5364 RepID=A0A5C3NFP7_9AGAM|nr:WD40 repeat-like protein [Heliocybe sulcata]